MQVILILRATTAGAKFGRISYALGKSLVKRSEIAFGVTADFGKRIILQCLNFLLS